jgi:DNA-binding transcriptional LysR family regulator
MHIPWDEVQLFLALAEGGSVTSAARRLQITQPTASRRLTQLEATLGEPLFSRSVEGIALTAYGERLLEPARRMAEWAGEVDRAADRREITPRGVVRITAPPGIAADFLAPFAVWIRTKLPEVQLAVRASVDYLDLARREADLAMRFQRPTQRELVTLGTLELEVGAFAAPSYVRTLKRGYGVADVAWIAWAPPMDHLSPNPELAALLPGFTPAFASDDFLVQQAAAEAGAGAMFLGRVTHRFSRASLVELDLDLGRVPRALHLVCAKSALDIPRVRAVADLLVAELGRTAAPRAKGARGRAG